MNQPIVIENNCRAEFLRALKLRAAGVPVIVYENGIKVVDDMDPQSVPSTNIWD